MLTALDVHTTTIKYVRFTEQIDEQIRQGLNYVYITIYKNTVRGVNNNIMTTMLRSIT